MVVTFRRRGDHSKQWEWAYWEYLDEERQEVGHYLSNHY